MSLVHIHQPKGHYIGQVRDYGHRNWRTVTKKHKSQYTAMARTVMLMQRHSAKRGRVLFCAEWYEPIVMMECNK